MAGELLGERWMVRENIDLEEFWSGYDPTTYFMQDADGAGTPAMEHDAMCGHCVAGTFVMSAFPVFAAEAGASSRLPESADPPFPPVYPYFFSTAQIYGREHMNNVIRLVRNDDYPFSGDIEVDGSPLNLTGATITMTAKWSYKHTSNVFQLSNATSGITVTDAAGGEVDVEIPASATATLPDTETPLVYDIEVLTASGKTHTVARGTLLVLPDATV
jgi:hypothetical protein